MDTNIHQPIEIIYKGADRRKQQDDLAYFDSLVEAKPLEIPINRFKCSNIENAMLVTTVGSGICICIHEPNIKAGGLGHILLPYDFLDEFPSVSEDGMGVKKYFELQVDSMITTLKQLGGKTAKMRVKLFGGGKIRSAECEHGHKTYVFVKEMLVRKGLNIISEDIGQRMGRRIQYIPVSGRGMRRLLKRDSDLEILYEIETGRPCQSSEDTEKAE